MWEDNYQDNSFAYELPFANLSGKWCIVRVLVVTKVIIGSIGTPGARAFVHHCPAVPI